MVPTWCPFDSEHTTQTFTGRSPRLRLRISQIRHSTRRACLCARRLSTCGCATMDGMKVTLGVHRSRNTPIEVTLESVTDTEIRIAFPYRGTLWIEINAADRESLLRGLRLRRRPR